MMSMWNTFTDAFYLNFVSENRWKYLTDGLKTTLIITLFACLMGIVLGFIVGMIRSTYEKTHKRNPRHTCNRTAVNHLFRAFWQRED